MVDIFCLCVKVYKEAILYNSFHEGENNGRISFSGVILVHETAWFYFRSHVA